MTLINRPTFANALFRAFFYGVADPDRKKGVKPKNVKKGQLRLWSCYDPITPVSMETGAPDKDQCPLCERWGHLKKKAYRANRHIWLCPKHNPTLRQTKRSYFFLVLPLFLWITWSTDIGAKTQEPGQVVVQTGRSDRICHSFVLSLDSCLLVQTHDLPIKFVVEPSFFLILFRFFSRFTPKKCIFLKIFLRLTVSEYTRQLLSFEEYSFSLEEVTENASKDATSVRRALNRLIEKKEIVNLRKGFYLIIPPRYSNSQKLPLQLYADKLFKYLKRKYYIGLYSAAKIHGASHQQTQRDYLIIETPKLNTVKKENFDIKFHTTANWPKNNIEKKKSDAGIFKVASPVLTFIDLIHHHTKIGGLNRMLASLEELTEELNEKDIQSLLHWYDNKSSLQRTGFLLEEILGSNGFSDMIFQKLKQQPFYPVLLSPKKNEKPGSVDNRWKIDINLRLESDL